MAKKKVAKKKTSTPAPEKNNPSAEKRSKHQVEKKWSQIGKLADEALATLVANDPKQTRELLKAIRGVAMSADNEKL